MNDTKIDRALRKLEKNEKKKMGVGGYDTAHVRHRGNKSKKKILQHNSDPSLV
jgi:hypothetical protein